MNKSRENIRKLFFTYKYIFKINYKNFNFITSDESQVFFWSKKISDIQKEK